MSENPITVDDELTLKSAGAETTSTNGTGKAIGPSGWVKVSIVVSAVSGSGDTLTIALQSSTDDAGTDAYAAWFASTFPAITAVGVYEAVVKLPEKWIRYISTHGDVGGGGTSFTYAIYVHNLAK